MDDMELNRERDKLLAQIGNAEAQAIRESNYPAYIDLAVLHMIVILFDCDDCDEQQEALDYAVRMWGCNGGNEE